MGLVLILVCIVIPIIAVFIWFYPVKLIYKMIVTIVGASLVILFIGYGHSEWNRTIQLKTKLNSLHIADYPDNTAIIQAINHYKHPLQIKIVSTIHKANAYTYHVQINHHPYQIQLVQYTHNLIFYGTPYQTWSINKINPE